MLPSALHSTPSRGGGVAWMVVFLSLLFSSPTRSRPSLTGSSTNVRSAAGEDNTPRAMSRRQAHPSKRHFSARSWSALSKTRVRRSTFCGCGSHRSSRASTFEVPDSLWVPSAERYRSLDPGRDTTARMFSTRFASPFHPSGLRCLSSLLRAQGAWRRLCGHRTCYLDCVLC